ncbi:MAG: AAA family ATPase [Alphaproteobacteria bacterium]|nr:AAA family ATPase [Alphaproteobacteria bacterium]
MIMENYIANSFEDIVIQLSKTKSQKISIKKLYDVKGVNRLIESQEICFGDNLTVIYGENGTGKTGYSRIIQHAGKYITNIKPIKANVFDDTIQPEAKIDYILEDGSVHKTLEWCAEKDGELNIKLFNSNCVQFSLSGERKISFKPQIFNICEQLSVITSAFNEKVSIRLEELKQDIISTIEQGTTVSKTISKILEDPKEENLQIFDDFIREIDLKKAKEEKEKSIKEIELLSVGGLTQTRKMFETKKETIDQIVETIEKSNVYTQCLWSKYIENEAKVANLEQEGALEEILKKLNIDNSIKDEFLNFIFAVDKYYKGLQGESEDFLAMDRCVFCGREISQEDEDIRKLFALYNDLIKANNSKQIDEINRNNKKIEESIKSLVDKLVVLKASPALIDEIAVIAQIEVVVELFKQFKEITIENQVANSIQTLKNISDQLKIKIKSIEEDIACIDAKRLQAHNALNEAAAKIYIVENSSYKRKMILAYLRLCRLQGINNKALSKCQKDIEEKVYKDKFVEILQNTLKALNAPAEVKFTTAISSAQMAIKQGYDKIAKTNQLNEILSEGEQTVVALAQFIAESKFNPEENVLFFDDPVNSLDLGRMQIIAENLVELSKEKQVVIFTHNLVFLGFIKAIIDKDESLQHYKFFTTERAEVDGKLYVGKVTETANPNVERLKHYNTKINELIQFYNKNTCTIDNVKQLYGYLRAAIELFICEKVLQGTVERFRFEIRVGKFSEINVAALQKNQLKLTNIFEKCCRFIDGHSSSPYAKLNPDFTGFKADYEEFNQIKKEFK